jgi:hypothetical protein
MSDKDMLNFKDRLSEVKKGWSEITKGQRKVAVLGGHIVGLLLVSAFFLGINLGSVEPISVVYFWSVLGFQQITWVMGITYLHINVGKIW